VTARRIAALAAVAILVVVTAPAALAAPLDSRRAAPPPLVYLIPATPGVGEIVTVAGQLWPPGTEILVELCGNLARRGTADCDQLTSVDSSVAADGTIRVPMTIGHPPAACPCVVKVTDVNQPISVVVPVDLPALPSDDDQVLQEQFPDVHRALKVVSVKLTGRGPWLSWFGAAPRRTLVVTIRNTGNVSVTDPDMVLAVGKGSSPTGIVNAPALGTIAPGTTRTYRIPVDLGSLAVGHYMVAGSVTGFDTAVSFRAKTSTYPWGLGIIVLLVLQLVLLELRNVVRRRIHDEPGEEDDLAPADAALEDVEPASDLLAESGADDEDADVDADVAVAALAALNLGERVVATDDPDLLDQDDAASPESPVPQVGVPEAGASPAALVSVLAQPSASVQQHAAELDSAAAAALVRLAQDAKADQAAVGQRHNVARLDLDHARGSALELLELARTASMRLLADAEGRARRLVEQARDAGGGLLNDAAAEVYDGVPPAEGPMVVDLLAQTPDALWGSGGPAPTEATPPPTETTATDPHTH
jgi:hypothetical protein